MKDELLAADLDFCSNLLSIILLEIMCRYLIHIFLFFNAELSSEKAVIEWWGSNKHNRQLIQSKIDNFMLAIEEMDLDMDNIQAVKKKGRKRKAKEAESVPSFQKMRLKSILARYLIYYST